MNMEKQEHILETRRSFQIYFQALLIGLIVGILGSAFHYCLNNMPDLYRKIVRAPLTGIVLVAEMTASFELLPALIVTCMVASITANALGSKPIYDLLLERTLQSK